LKEKKKRGDKGTHYLDCYGLDLTHMTRDGKLIKNSGWQLVKQGWIGI